MMGRQDYTREELDGGRTRIGAAAPHAALAKTVGASKDATIAGALSAFDAGYFNDLMSALDRLYVQRVRKVTGNDTNPLTEVDLLVDSILDHGGVLTKLNAIKYVPQQSLVGLQVGDEITLTGDQFAALSTAFFAELEERFVTV